MGINFIILSRIQIQGGIVKILSIFIALAFSWSALACPNLEGRYLSVDTVTDENSAMVVHQKDCAGMQVTLTTYQSTHTFNILLDGKMRLMNVENGLEVMQSFDWRNQEIVTFQSVLKEGVEVEYSFGRYSVDPVTKNILQEMTQVTSELTLTSRQLYTRRKGTISLQNSFL